MPANPKYLSTSFQRVIKIIAAIIGGYLVTIALHFVIGMAMNDKKPVVATTIWSAWLVWVFFMVVAFGAKRPLRILLYYFLAVAALGGLMYLIK